MEPRRGINESTEESTDVFGYVCLGTYSTRTYLICCGLGRRKRYCLYRCGSVMKELEDGDRWKILAGTMVIVVCDVWIQVSNNEGLTETTQITTKGKAEMEVRR